MFVYQRNEWRINIFRPYGWDDFFVQEFYGGGGGAFY